MEWWMALLVIFSGAMGLLAIGMPVAFAFLLVNMVGVFYFQGGGAAFNTFTVSMHSSVGNIALLPIPMFILMGEMLWRSGVAFNALTVLDQLLGRLPGRLSVLTVLTGTLFSSLSGSTMANTALLGTMMLPEMDKRGYRRPMSIGPIIGSGGLAMIIPPSALAVILAAIAKLSIAQLLIGAVVPGLIMAVLYIGYIIIRCKLQPELTPAYEVERVPWRVRLVGAVVHLLPLGIIIFLVTGVIVVGIATPTEGAALGCLGAVAMAAAYRRLTFKVLFDALEGTVRISVLMLVILVGAVGFSQILAYTGATRGLLDAVLGMNADPMVLLLLMLLIVLVLGCFMEQVAIMMITLPIFIPLVKSLGLDPIWFGVLMLISLQMALTTPPFGMLLFVMKSVAPADVRMRDIYMAGMPFLACDTLALGLVILFPGLVTWLLTLMFT